MGDRCKHNVVGSMMKAHSICHSFGPSLPVRCKASMQGESDRLQQRPDNLAVRSSSPPVVRAPSGMGVQHRPSESPKSTLGGSKIDPKSSRKVQERPEASQGRPKSAQERPKRLQVGPKRRPRGSKLGPRGGQESRGSPQEPPKSGQEPVKSG